MSRRVLWFSASCLVVILALWGFFWFRSGEDQSVAIQSKRTAKFAHRLKSALPQLNQPIDKKMTGVHSPDQPEIQPTDKKESSETYSTETYQGMANSLPQQQDIQAAISFLRQAVKDNPHNEVLAVDLGLALIEANQWEEAKELFEKQLESNSKDPEALFGMGALYASQGDLNKAEQYYQYNLSVNPDHLDTKYNLADLYVFDKKDRPADAERYYQEVLEQLPENMDAKNGLAAVYLQTGRINEAIAQWQRLTEEHPQESILFSNLGEAYFKSGHYEEASNSVDKALAADPENADASYYKALVEKQRGHMDLYQHYYQEAITRDPKLASPAL